MKEPVVRQSRMGRERKREYVRAGRIARTCDFQSRACWGPQVGPAFRGQRLGAACGRQCPVKAALGGGSAHAKALILVSHCPPLEQYWPTPPQIVPLCI